MDESAITLTREQLHEMVWAEPVRKIASRLGLSDSGLAKICYRMRVPRPERGYWQRKAFGREVTRRELPALSTDITIQRSVTLGGARVGSNSATMQTEAHSAVMAERSPERLIRVPTTLADTHPLVDRTARALRRARKDHRGVLMPDAKRILDVRVTRGTLDRVVLIADALVKALVERGYHIMLEEGGKRQTSVEVSGEQVSFSIEEIIRRVERAPLKPARQSRWGYVPPTLTEYEYVATGELAVKIIDVDISGTRRTWRDSPTRLLELRLNAFLAGLFVAAEAKKAARERRAQWRREHEERERLASERRLRQMEEEAKVRLLDADLSRRARSTQIVEYVNAVRSTAITRPLAEEERKKLEEWLDWALNYAERIDPAQRGAAPKDWTPWDPR